MDDFKIILYLLAAVAYFVLTQWRKAFKSPDEEQEDLPHSRQEQPKQGYPNKPFTSFDEILDELKPNAERGKAIMEENIDKAKEVLPPLAPEPVRKYRSYENKPPKALSWEKTAEALEAAKNSKLRREGEFVAYVKEDKRKIGSKYAQLLKDPTSAREAFVFSEIFNKKYN